MNISVLWLVLGLVHAKKTTTKNYFFCIKVCLLLVLGISSGLFPLPDSITSVCLGVKAMQCKAAVKIEITKSCIRSSDKKITEVCFFSS